MSYSDVILADAPVTYLRMDENITSSATPVVDAGSAGGNATITGYVNIGSQQNPAGTMAGYSMHFNNNQGYLQKVSSLTSTSDWTMEVWYKRDKAYGDGANNSNVMQWSATGRGTSYWLIGSGGNFLYYHGGTLAINTTATGSLNDGNWHHIVLVQSGTTVTVYVDGVSKATKTSASTGAFTTATLSVGASSTGIAAYLDEATFYGKALSSAQIQSHYVAGTTIPTMNVTATPPVINVGDIDMTPATVFLPIDKIVAVPAMTVSLATIAPANVSGTTVAVATADRFSSGDGSSTAIQIAPFAAFQFPDPIGGGQYPLTSTLHLSGYSFVGGTATIRVYRATQAWTEGTSGNIAYDSTPLASYTPVAADATAGTHTLSFDVTSMMQGVADGKYPNYGLIVIGGTSPMIYTKEYATAAYRPNVETVYGTRPPQPITVSAPAMALNLISVAPGVVAQANTALSVPAISAGTVDTAAPVVSTTSNTVNAIPAITAGVSFVGGQPTNPDFVANAGVMNVGLTAPTANAYIRVDAIVQVPSASLGSVETEPITIDLTTNRRIAVPAMGLGMKWPGLYVESADRYLSILPGTLDSDDVWYKMGQDSGTRAIDTAGPITENGYYFGGPSFSTIDGPQGRKAVHFDGIDDYMVAGPYGNAGTGLYDNNNNINSAGMELTVEFSIRTTQLNGTIFNANGGGDGNRARLVQSYYPWPLINGYRMAIKDGYLYLYSATSSIKVRDAFMSDGEWHHVIVSLPKKNAVNSPDYTDQIPSSFVMFDGQPVLVRRGTLLGGDGFDWLPYSFMANADYKATLVTGGYQPVQGASVKDNLAGDLRDVIVRLNTYMNEDTAEKIYYEWSNAAVVYPEPITVSLGAVNPFKVEGNTKKMIALYGLEWGRSDRGFPLYTYMSTLSGLVIDNMAGVTSVQADGTFMPSPVYPNVKTFRVGDYLIYPVSIMGDRSSVGGVLNPDADTYSSDNGGFVDNRTGLPRFINLQDDVLNLDDFDAVTVVNYPWARPETVAAGSTQWSYTTAYPANGELNQNNRGLTDAEWGAARDELRDSILQAAYDGMNLWVGEYHMAQHLGFISGYDMHGLGTIAADRNTHALDLDRLYNTSPAVDYLGQNGHFVNIHQTNTSRRIVQLIPGLTDLPTTEYGDMIQGYNNDRFKSNGDFVAYNIVDRPKGLQVGDLVKMSIAGARGGIQFFGNTPGIDIPNDGRSASYGYWNGSLYSEGDVGVGANAYVTAVLRTSIISAHPDGIAGTVVAREQTGYWGNDGVWVENPYANNVTTIAAEVGTVVRGRAIAGRAFIEMMETNIAPTTIREDRDKYLWHGEEKYPTKISSWDFDARRSKEVLIKITNTQIKVFGGALGLDTTTVNYMTFGDVPEIYHRSETMHSRGLNWLSQTPQLSAGDVIVYGTAMTLNLTSPAPVSRITKNPTVQVNNAMRLDLEVRQPANYSDGSVTEHALPMEISLEMRGLGKVVNVDPMVLSLGAVAPIALASADKITVFIDADSNTTTLFLKEDN